MNTNYYLHTCLHLEKIIQYCAYKCMHKYIKIAYLVFYFLWSHSFVLEDLACFIHSFTNRRRFFPNILTITGHINPFLKMVQLSYSICRKTATNHSFPPLCSVFQGFILVLYDQIAFYQSLLWIQTGLDMCWFWSTAGLESRTMFVTDGNVCNCGPSCPQVIDQFPQCISGLFPYEFH